MGRTLKLIPVALSAFCLLATAPDVSAQAPESLTQISANGGAPGEGAGELNNPRGLAADPESGHVYVADRNNSRISEFTPWGLFVKAWGWGVADGEEEAQTCGPDEPEEVPDADLCQKGSEGAGNGQFAVPTGIAVDGIGDVYVFERGNRRVQKFSLDGEFMLMFGGEVNGTSGGDVCPRPGFPGDVCKAGTGAGSPSSLATTAGAYISYSPAAEAIVVGGEGHIKVFDLDGTYREEIGFEGDLQGLAGRAVNALDVDAAGNIYFSVAGHKDVFKINAAGEPLAPGVPPPGESAFKAQVPEGVAVDVEGGVYVIDEEPVPEITPERAVLKYSATGVQLIPTSDEESGGDYFPYVPFQGASLTAIATNHCVGSDEPGNLYVGFFDAGSDAFVNAYGTPPIGCEPPPEKPPHISDQYATGVGLDAATLQAQINPRFWPDATYQVQYGTSPCDEGGCTETLPAVAAPLTTKSTNQPLQTAELELEGLLPETEYFYRFVSVSGGGGPVFGKGGGEEEKDEEGNVKRDEEGNIIYRIEGEESSFRTFDEEVLPPPPCANDDFREGPGLKLPDCRAFERVSPADKAGGEAALWRGEAAFIPRQFEIHRSTPAGERFTFSSKRAFADPDSALSISQYLSHRVPDSDGKLDPGEGWQSKAIAPPFTTPTVGSEQMLANNPFQLFSPDLCEAWMRSYSTAPLTEDAIPGYANLYRRDVCTEGPYQALSTVKPPSRLPTEYIGLRAHGASADGAHTIFVSNDKLHPDAPVLLGDLLFRELLLYEHTPTGIRFVCYLPDETPVSEQCAPGTPAGVRGADRSNTHNAISADGSVIYWSAFSGAVGGVGPTQGQLFARVNGEETIAVSGQIAGAEPALYWTAPPDGSRALFSFTSGAHEGELYEFDLTAEEATLLATGVIGPMGSSEDATRVYFASEDDLDGGGPGAAGANNLYLHDTTADVTTFVMELAPGDIGGLEEVPSAISQLSFQREARVTPDGLHATFSSLAPPPSGYENLDPDTGERVREVYRYDAAANELRCISCNPTGARPVSEKVSNLHVAARIQGWESNGHAPRAISNDGTRVFFESIEALVPRDTNGTWDVYQWEEPGTGTCTTEDPTYGSESGGCVELISSGDSPSKSVFLDADATGQSVFFSTRSRLIAADEDGLNDVYVARVNGGFPDPPEPPEPCEGEGCRDAAPDPPALPGAATPHFVGPPNPAFKPCARFARRAGALARQAKGLRTRARKAARAAKRSQKPGLTRSLARKARRHAGAAKRRSGAAKRLSSAAKRCRNPQAKSPQRRKGARR